MGLQQLGGFVADVEDDAVEAVLLHSEVDVRATMSRGMALARVVLRHVERLPSGRRGAGRLRRGPPREIRK